MKPLLITIDGPAGAGKTSVSRMLAARLGYKVVDTGALYRAVAYHAKSAGLQPDDDNGLEKLCSSLKLKFIQNEKGQRLLSGESDISDKIRTPEITMLSSAVSARPVVRTYLLKIQREIGREKRLIFEGRDMGTVVFPDADVKFFLTASLKTRSLRRYQELASQPLEAVAEDMKRRDSNDTNRTLSPLQPAQDAVIIDSTDLSLEAVAEKMLSHINALNE